MRQQQNASLLNDLTDSKLKTLDESNYDSADKEVMQIFDNRITISRYGNKQLAKSLDKDRYAKMNKVGRD